MEAKILVLKKEMMEQKWEKWRNKGIGGNDAAAIQGAHPYKNVVEVYLEKIGEPPDKTITESMQMSRKLSDFIAQEFMARTEYKVIRRFALFQHSTHRFMLAGTDRWILHENGPNAKTLMNLCGTSGMTTGYRIEFLFSVNTTWPSLAQSIGGWLP